MKILMLSATFPYPPTAGGTQVRTFNLLKYLQQHHQITLVTQRDYRTSESEIAQLQGCVDDLVVFDHPRSSENTPGLWKKITRLRQFLQQGTPPNVLNRYSTAMQAWVDDFVHTGKCDVITCEHSVNEIYVRSHFQTQQKTIVNIHSSVYGTCRNQLATGITDNRLRDTINLPLLRRYEQSYCTKFSEIVVTTPEDKLQLQKFNPHSKITVIPNGVDLSSFPHRPTDPGGHRLIFLGAMDNLANIDAVCFFCHEVLPEIQKLYPDTSFDIVGARPTDTVLALQQRQGVNVTGAVPVMVEYLHRATICVVPMRTGFGIKNKTLEAMAAGVPIVASDRGLEGLDVDTPLRALRANQPQEYVAAITHVFENPQLRRELSINSRQLVESEFTWDIAGQRYEQVCRGLNPDFSR
jgi:glycosyltransferase involved in cell wall biosynthesis